MLANLSNWGLSLDVDSMLWQPVPITVAMSRVVSCEQAINDSVSEMK